MGKLDQILDWTNLKNYRNYLLRKLKISKTGFMMFWLYIVAIWKPYIVPSVQKIGGDLCSFIPVISLKFLLSSLDEESEVRIYSITP